MLRIRIFILLPIFLLMFTSCENENPIDPPKDGFIQGKITDNLLGSPVINASVFTKPPSSVVSTDSTGGYLIDGLEPNQYVVIAKCTGFITDSVEIIVRSGRTTTADIKLAKISSDTSIGDTTIYKLIKFTFQPGPGDGKDATIWDLPYNTKYASHSGRCHNVNEGSATNIRASSWTYFGDKATSRSFLQFDLNEVEVDVIVDSALLYLYSRPVTEIHSGDNAFLIHRVIQPWEEETIIWDNQPSISDNIFVRSVLYIPPSNSEDQDYIIDITGLVRYWKNNPNTNFGLRLSLVKEEPYNIVYFASSDFDKKERRPKLIIYGRQQ